MNLGYESDRSNHRENIPSTIDEVIESITPIAWLDNPLTQTPACGVRQLYTSIPCV